MFNWTHYIVALIHSAHRSDRCNPISIRRYDHKHVIAGQGTAGKELFEDIKRQHGIDGLDYMFVCVGGGGLISGCALSAHHFSPNCKVIGVEPEAGNDAQQSLEKGEIVQTAEPSEQQRALYDVYQETSNLTPAATIRDMLKVVSDRD